MDIVNRELEARRKAIASRSCFSFSPSQDEIVTMVDFNQKVDLRPRSMIRDSNIRNGKPPVDAVLSPDQRAKGIPFTVSDLQSVTLRKTKTKERMNVNTSRVEIDSDSDVPFTVNMESNTLVDRLTSRSPSMERPKSMKEMERKHELRVPPPPPPPPPPVPNQSSHCTVDPAYELLGMLEEARTIRKHDLEERKKLEEEISKLRNQTGKFSIELDPNDVFRDINNDLDKQIKMTTDMVDKAKDARKSIAPVRFDKTLLKDKNFRIWIKELVNDEFDRASRYDNNDIIDAQQPQPRDTRKWKNLWDYPVTSDNEDARSTTSTRKSTRSVRSIGRSVKSVIFKGAEEEEIRSEIDAEDVADRDVGDTGFVKYTATKFTIHGPFVDTELNVFHAICKEYEVAADISFARRNSFSRTRPPHDRVYALLGSNRRSRWTNQGDWMKANHDLQILDFIFRKTIRSKSRVIKQPVMELEHFIEGCVLDERRFRWIIRGIYSKRDRLLTSMGIKVIHFDKIK